MRSKKRASSVKIKIKPSEYRRESIDQLCQSEALIALQRTQSKRSLKRQNTAPPGSWLRRGSVSPPHLDNMDAIPEYRKFSSPDILNSSTLKVPDDPLKEIPTGEVCISITSPLVEVSNDVYYPDYKPLSLHYTPDTPCNDRDYSPCPVARSARYSAPCGVSVASSGVSVASSGVSVASSTKGQLAQARRKSSVYTHTALHTIAFSDKSSSKNKSNSSHVMSECWFRFIMCITFLLIYLLFGAGMYSKLEHRSEKEEYREMILYWKDFKSKHNISQPLMKKFLDSHYYTCQHGDKGKHDGMQWDYPSSLFFAGTVVTTIGYGHVAPHTIGGRLFTIIYAYFGIPMMLGLLNVVAEMLLALLRTLKEKIKKIQTIFQYEVFLSANITTIIFTCSMMGVYGQKEKTWNLLDSFYFAFVTMTTIGFGDYVPGQANGASVGVGGAFYECINLIVYILAVVVWYFQAHVTAQILKSKMRFLYSVYLMKIKNKGEDCSDEEDVESEESEESVAYKTDTYTAKTSMQRRVSLPNARICSCVCSCGGTGGLPNNRGIFNKNKPPINRHALTNGAPPTDLTEPLITKLLSLQEEDATSSSSSLDNFSVVSEDQSPSDKYTFSPIISDCIKKEKSLEKLPYNRLEMRPESISPDESYLFDISAEKRLTKSAGDITSLSEKSFEISNSQSNLAAKNKKVCLLVPPRPNGNRSGSANCLHSKSTEFLGFQTVPFENVNF